MSWRFKRSDLCSEWNLAWLEATGAVQDAVAAQLGHYLRITTRQALAVRGWFGLVDTPVEIEQIPFRRFSRHRRLDVYLCWDDPAQATFWHRVDCNYWLRVIYLKCLSSVTTGVCPTVITHRAVKWTTVQGDL